MNRRRYQKSIRYEEKMQAEAESKIEAGSVLGAHICSRTLRYCTSILIDQISRPFGHRCPGTTTQSTITRQCGIQAQRLSWPQHQNNVGPFRHDDSADLQRDLAFNRIRLNMHA
ncbi:F-box family protein [Dorcoceras hygrometricum]|uniref:F-box family protein n=1 Tax=Dorcoceras hygrometricum TaxID=472368 RepID=A0A2Z7AA47_9LAMI|nr:F-box family protein [Dorcoceras hygrometricum]